MDLFEYQARDLFEAHNIPVLAGAVATTADEAEKAASVMGGRVVVKAQVKIGGRGKAGGVKLAQDASDAREKAAAILGMDIKGHTVHKVMIAQAAPIAEEYYASILLDRANRNFLVMASVAGGMEIEEVAAKDPDAILKEVIEPGIGLQPYQARKLAFGIGIPAAAANAAVQAMLALSKACMEMDATLAEINPFILTKDNKVYALDAKINFDDNALFRHKDVVELRDVNEEDPLEVEASKFGLNYIKLDGNIACMVNGAGLAMATMDIIQYAGGTPANFLDVGGGASAEQVKNAFRILLGDPAVKAVLINIFGGILRCDTLAAGVVAAARDLGIAVPIVIRMEGTNVKEGQLILKESGFNFIVADGMKDAAEKVVAAAGGSN